MIAVGGTSVLESLYNPLLFAYACEWIPSLFCEGHGLLYIENLGSLARFICCIFLHEQIFIAL